MLDPLRCWKADEWDSRSQAFVDGEYRPIAANLDLILSTVGIGSVSHLIPVLVLQI